jgi:dATP pyrophosphohydrolase
MKEIVPIACFGVSVVILRELDNKVETLLLKRKKPIEGVWYQVGGHIEKSETAWQAAFRELKEETGFTPISFYSADYLEQFYSYEDNQIQIVPTFIAYVDPKLEVYLNDEHSTCAWISIEKAIDYLVFPGQKKLFNHIKEYFIDRVPNELLKIELTATNR